MNGSCTHFSISVNVAANANTVWMDLNALCERASSMLLSGLRFWIIKLHKHKWEVQIKKYEAMNDFVCMWKEQLKIISHYPATRPLVFENWRSVFVFSVISTFGNRWSGEGSTWLLCNTFYWCLLNWAWPKYSNLLIASLKYLTPVKCTWNKQDKNILVPSVNDTQYTYLWSLFVSDI